jgi:hypothetical protein
MKSRIFNLDWESFNYADPAQRQNLVGALQYFVALPNRFVPSRFERVEEFVKANRKIQEFTMMSDGYPNEKAIDVVEKFHLMTEYDNAYEQIFDVRDFSGSKASGFDVSGVSSGLTFNEIIPGEKLKVYQMSGAKYRCYFSYYGGALGWHRQLFEDGDWWTIEDNAIEFRNAAYSSRAAVYYALLEAAADANGCCAVVPADCSDCHADAKSIADSLNFAAMSILLNVRNRGYNLNPQTTEFIVLTPIQLRGRVRQALGVRTQSFAESTGVIDYSFRQITSMMLTNPNRVMVILPKRTLKLGYRMDLTLFDDFDMLSYTDTVAGWMRHGGCIGDTDQIACVEFTAQSGSCPNPDEAPLGTTGRGVTDQDGETMTEGIKGLPGDFDPR